MAKEKEFVKNIADMHEDFPQWYTDVVLKTELVDYGPVKGTMVIRPYGYAIWEVIQREMDKRFKESGHENAYFPMLIPYSYLVKETEHVEGFAPEVALVTHVGDQELPEKLVVRPTSETIICEMYRRWVQSYRDLPVLINQWANVVRWEKTTRPFLRTSEFLWQEGHTLHASEAEAREETLRMLNIYEEFSRNVLAIPMFTGRKSEKEKFAGAKETYSIEAMMQDGKSLQSGTSHYFGNSFAEAFDIKTSWGVSTRLIGAVIMTHGDQRGLCLPPAIAPVQAVIIPVAMHKDGVLDKCREVYIALKSVARVKLDDRDFTPGWKFNEYEMKGVPVRIEIGPRDIENGVATVARRDKTEEKFTIRLDDIATELPKLLADIQANMYNKALAFRDSHVKIVSDTAELKDAVDSGNFALGMWCGDRECEDKIKEITGASTRNMPFDQTPCGDKCVCCGKKATKKIYFGKAY